MESDRADTPEATPTLYVVVCTSFHSAIGPYLDPAVALETARELNSRKDGCRYVPVPMPLPEGTQMAATPPASTDPEYRPGGYL